MKIVAKPNPKQPPFKDYYDRPGRQLGDTPIYPRDERLVNLPRRQGTAAVSEILFKNRLYTWSRQIYRMGVLGVAGQLYPYLWQSKSSTPDDPLGYLHYFYKFTPDKKGEVEVLKALREAVPVVVLSNLQPADVVWDWQVYKDIVQVNVCLRDYDFQRMLPPAQAAQAIDTYLSNIAVTPEVVPAPMSEKDALQAKGFDKWTFKKLPTKIGAKSSTR